MSITFTDPELAALDNSVISIGIFVRINTAPVVQRLWLGCRPIDPGVNVYDAGGDLYYGLGEISNVPEFEVLLMGQAERIDLSLSGVSQRIFDLVASNVSALKYVDVDIGIMLFDTSWQPLGPIRWIKKWTADLPGFAHVGARSPDETTARTVKLSVVSQLAGIKRPPYAYCTDQDQQRRSPGDLFFDHAKLYTQEVDKPWPPAS